MIVCFSGTGNSAAVARILDKTLDHSDHVVWVSPVHAWGLPRMVLQAIYDWPTLPPYISSLGTPKPDANHWLVLTCGDDVGRTPDVWRNALKRKGIKAKSAFSVRMPNTYVNLPGFDVDSQPIAQSKLNAMPDRVAAIAAAIAANKDDDDVIPGRMASFKTRVLNPLFNYLLMSPKRFTVNDNCTKCGICASECPVNNITMTPTGPTFGTQCTTCMACYHACPSHCINRPLTKNHGQYRILKSKAETKSPQG